MILYKWNLRSKQQKTFDALFQNPTRSNIFWSDIESLLIALGAEVSVGRGSRVRFALDDIRATFHRPHPEKETDKGVVKSMRRFLTEAGIKKTGTENDEI
ncbi:type II toxin-antitoxin system HicA family toxin [Nostoc sp.]|uniref:type II toxin-antitoxin system HicA family toxin n=1 Tax=Nostoc sp. TaxID=1180 RepID=UPI002FF91B16